MNELITQNTKSGEPDIKKIWEKFQDKNEFIIYNDIRNTRENQITDLIQEFDPNLSGHLDNGTWID